MVVDPHTGLPIDAGGVAPRSMPGTYGTAVGQNVGVQNPLYYDAMEAIPPVTTTVAWNMSRVRRTILNNNQASRFNRNAGGLRQTFSPLRFRSLADVGNLDPDFIPSGRSSPMMPSRKRRFNRATSKGMLPSDPTKLSRRRARASLNPLTYGHGPLPPPRVPLTGAPTGWAVPSGQRYKGRRSGYTPFQVSGLLDGLYSNTKGGKVLAANNERLFAPAAFGTAATGATMMAGRISARQLDNVVDATGRFAGNTANMRKIGSVSRMTYATGARVEAGTYLTGAFQSSRFANAKITGKATGYFAGAQAERLGTMGYLRRGIEDAGKLGSYYDEAAKTGASAFKAGGLGARVVGSSGASVAARAAGPVGMVLLVGDLARFGGKIMGRGMRLGIDAVKSAEGDLSKPGPFGMGYQDNSVAATSRQRGVMAIANSRMNARSALGQEAAFLYQNFG